MSTPLPKPKVLHGPQGLKHEKLQGLNMPPALPTGPRMYKPLPMDEGGYVGGPGLPPPGFLGPFNSITEWFIYWALAKIFGEPQEYRKPPFEGGWPDWTYQKAFNGGRDMPGGSVIDFVVYNPGPARNAVALRIVTEYWHIFTTAEKQTSDTEQRFFLEDNFILMDIYDQDFINDSTGQAAIQVVKSAIGLIEKPNPMLLGTALRGSHMGEAGGYFY